MQYLQSNKKKLINQQSEIQKLKRKIKTIHSNAVRRESTGGGLVFESAKVVLGTDILKLGVVLEGVNSAFSLNGVSALSVVVVGEEELLRAVELSPATNGLFRPVVPPDSDLNVVPMVGLDLLYSRHVRRLVGVRRSHQNTVTS